MDQKKTGEFLKQLRLEKQMTQEQLAEKFNVSSRSVSRWETGRNLPDISLLVEIADFYDVDVREIIEGERKSEMMDKEVRDVANKMANYADNEKGALLRGIQVAGVIGVILSLLAIVFQMIAYEPDIRRAAAIFISFIIFILISFMTLYVTGLLQKVVKKKKFMLVVKIVVIGAIVFVVGRMAIFAFAIVLLLADSMLAKKEVYTDIAKYSELFVDGDTKYSHTQKDDMFKVFPKEITSDMNVKDFKYTYYNPWDPQYVAYLTVEYDESAYEIEMNRLKNIGIEEYKNIYTVTDEPDGYDLIAMDSDEYYGFVYAMLPEGASEDSREITYVGLWFCNYFLDLDYTNYIPNEYILKGFNGTNYSPYCLQKRKELQEKAGGF